MQRPGQSSAIASPGCSNLLWSVDPLSRKASCLTLVVSCVVMFLQGGSAFLPRRSLRVIWKFNAWQTTIVKHFALRLLPFSRSKVSLGSVAPPLLNRPAFWACSGQEWTQVSRWRRAMGINALHAMLRSATSLQARGNPKSNRAQEG